ncbi:hypothetical protein BDF14DRAFT_1870671 [Spinellus fusiger]|nr:hypothetical protein BDF14DRAFT_1870671 [Spinellus fusiger]
MTCVAALPCLAKTELLCFPCLSISSFFSLFCPYFSSSTPCFSIFSLFQSTLFILLITILLVIQDC